MNDNYFLNKVVLITGSTRGIGKKLALTFAKLGANVIINGNEHLDDLKETYELVREINPNAIMVKANIADEFEVQNLFNIVYDTFGTIDILINNAGISLNKTITDTTAEEWRKVIDTNLSASFLVSKEALSAMIRNKNGCIINISSMWGLYGASCEVAYSASKGGLNTFTKALAKEVGPSGIRVNAIACGFIDTTMNNTYTEDEKRNFIYNHTMLDELGTTQDIANLAIFLASDKSRYITGQVISIDGGYC